MGLQLVMHILCPHAIGNARPKPARTPRTLVGSIAGDTNGFQPGEPTSRIEFRNTGISAVYDSRDALDGQRGLGDGRSQHHFSFPMGMWKDSFLLFLERKLTI